MEFAVEFSEFDAIDLSSTLSFEVLLTVEFSEFVVFNYSSAVSFEDVLLITVVVSESLAAGLSS